MDEKKNNPRDFDLTTPNLRLPPNAARPPERPSPQFDDSDRDSANTPYPREQRPNPSAPPRSNAFDLTMVNLRMPHTDDDDDEVPPPPRQQQQPAKPQPAIRPASRPTAPVAAAATATPHQRRVPMWAWLLGGGVATIILAAAAVVAYLILTPDPAFTLKVTNAPTGSRVFVDGIDRGGVPQADGTILVKGLKANEQRDIRVAHDGYREWTIAVEGAGGEVKEIRANMSLLVAEPDAEIDYNGRMVLVPVGPFQMGDDSHNPDERPMHTVELPAYYIDKYEVTNEQYQKFCDATNCDPPVNPHWDPRYYETNPRMPVIGISFAEAQGYARWANKRLPTEQEWEKAASWDPKAREKRQWPWGNQSDPERANMFSKHPTEVGQYLDGVSFYGVHDMAGNAREWVDAFYQRYPGSTFSDPNFGKNLRVVRGGDFRAKENYSRTTKRTPVSPELKSKPEDTNTLNSSLIGSSLIGFRCAVLVNDQKLQAFRQQTQKKK
ncbi:MAG: formylglycine-generating enzyme family protein [Acidobacteriota bacterium]|nr:formylglycine-generating enzyme family protein [Acidobacteriota bacterium]